MTGQVLLIMQKFFPNWTMQKFPKITFTKKTFARLANFLQYLIILLRQSTEERWGSSSLALSISLEYCMRFLFPLFSILNKRYVDRKHEITKWTTVFYSYAKTQTSRKPKKRRESFHSKMKNLKPEQQNIATSYLFTCLLGCLCTLILHFIRLKSREGGFFHHGSLVRDGGEMTDSPP